MPRTTVEAPVAAFRAALLLLCALLSVVASDRTYVALPIALLSALALAAERLPVLHRRPVLVGVVEAAVAGLSIGATGSAESPMLAYLLAPAACVGLQAGTRYIALVTLVGSATVLLGPLLDSGTDDLRPIATGAGQWLLLGAGLGVVGQRARVLDRRGPVHELDRYTEARALLQQLRAVSRQLPGGLDAAAMAEGLLERCASAMPSASRSAVLVQPSPGALVPIAVRGTRRVPWRAPLSDPGPLSEAWTTQQPVVDRRDPDIHGRRQGSTLVVVPLRSEGGGFGLVALESYDDASLDDACVQELQSCADAAALQLETALLFEEVRSAVSVAERDRLAREMHDGVAQDLAFIGYSLDDLRRAAAPVDEALAEKVTALRTTLSTLISDLRLSITDLRTSVSSERGLGSALTSYVRAIGSSGRLAVHLSLDESPFRLPGEQEALLLQIAQVFAQDARRTGEAANLWVTLTVDPPTAALVLEHDGPHPSVEEVTAFSAAMRRASGTLTVAPRSGAGIRVDAVLGEGGPDDGDRHARR